MNETNDKGTGRSLSSPRYHRIVAKLGTSLLTGGSDRLDEAMMSSLVAQIAQLHNQGLEFLLVTSGAMASGRYELGLTRKPKGVSLRQVLASVGQGRLMQVYDRLFNRHDITVAQALLTKTDLCDRAGYLNARNTLLALLELRVLCVINENDVVSTDEIKEAQFGDNDNLSAMVANLVDADLLLILGEVAGLYDADPCCDPGACLVPQVEKINSSIEQLAASTTSRLGIGGMVTKIEAAKLATASGVTVVIASGRENDVILRVMAGEDIGTRFLPVTSRMESRKRWMLSGLSAKGGVVVDEGAVQALKKYKRSLLAAGIGQVKDKFQRGDIVTIYGPEGSRLGCGISNYGSADVETIKGGHSRKIAALLGYDYGPEVVHRNNLVIF